MKFQGMHEGCTSLHTHLWYILLHGTSTRSIPRPVIHNAATGGKPDTERPSRQPAAVPAHAGSTN